MVNSRGRHPKTEPIQDGPGDETVLIAAGSTPAPAVAASLAKAKVASALTDDTQIRKWESLSEDLATTYRLPKLVNSDIYTEWFSSFNLVVTLTDSDYVFSSVKIPDEVAQCQFHASRISWFRRFIFASITHIPAASIPIEPRDAVVWLSERYQPSPGIEAMRAWSDIADLSLTTSDRPINDLQNKITLLKERACSADLKVSDAIWKLIVLRAVQESFPELTRDWLTTRWKVKLETLILELAAAEAAAQIDKKARKKKWFPPGPSASHQTKSPSINRIAKATGSVKPILADSLSWALDSGAWFHISNNAAVFSQLTSCAHDLVAANNSSLRVRGVGKVSMICGGSDSVITLTEVHYCPDANGCLVSTRRLEHTGHRIVWNTQGQPVEIFDRHNALVAAFHRTEGDYLATFHRPAVSSVKGKNADLYLLHQRFGHVNAHAIAKLIKSSKPDDFFCQFCVRAKAHRSPGRTSAARSTSSLELIHLDLAGGKQSLPEGLVESDDGLKSKVKYFLVITDDFTRYRWVRFATLKSEVPEIIRDFLNLCHTQFGKCPKALRSDGGREFDNIKVKGYLSSVGAQWQPTAGYAPEQNGVSERSIQTISSLSRTMVLQACLPQKHWPEAVSTAVYILNRSPLSTPTPHEKLLGDKPHVNHLRVFGCTAYAHEPLALTKLQDRARPLCLVGYEHSNIWRLLDPTTGRVVRRRDVTFDESRMCFSTAKEIGPEGSLPVYRSIPAINAIRPELSTGPISLKKALSGAGADAWRTAMNDEYLALVSNHVFDLVPRGQATSSVLPGLWVLKYKDDHLPKARWVIQGQLEEDLPFESTYAQVTHISTMRLIFAYAVYRGFHILQADISTAFLNSDIDRTVHMELPTGFRRDDLVCRLNKAIYSLRTAPKLWKDTFSSFVVELGFTPGAVDSSIFLLRDMILTVYVDDITLIGPERGLLESILTKMSQRFKMKILGNVDTYLGMKVAYDMSKGTLSLSHHDKIADLAATYKVSRELAPRVPIGQLDLEGKILSPSQTHDARSLLGSLLHIATFTRPDIAHSVAYLGRFMSAPTTGVMEALLKVLCYLVGTASTSIVFTRTSNSPDLEAFCDANWASLDEPRSTSGHVLYAFGSPVVWKSKRQTLASLSTCEAEYVAATEAVRDIEWFRRIFADITSAKSLVCIPLRIDNMAALFTALKAGYKARSRHYVVRDQYLRDAVSSGIVSLSHIATNGMKADGFTKSLSPTKHKSFLSDLCMSSG